LPTDVEVLGGSLKLFQHGRGEIDVHALDGFLIWPELLRKCETSFRHPGDGFG
jgi:hypothetical protein